MYYNTVLMKRLQISKPIFILYFLWIAASYAIYRLGLELPDPGSLQIFLFPLFALIFVIFGFLLTTYYLVCGKHRLDSHPRLRAGWLLFSLLLTVFLYAVGQRLEIGRPALFIINTANLFVLANLVGALLVKALRRPAELVILCVVVALADLFSILSGPTRAIVKSVKTYYEGGMKGPAPAGDFLLIKFPVAGFGTLHPVFGVSDWIIIVFLSAAALKFGINDNLAGKGLSAMDRAGRVSFYFPVAGFGLLLAMAAANLLDLFIPVLPLIAVVYIVYLLLYYPASRQLKKTDWLLMAGFSAGMGFLLALGFFMTG